MGRLGDEETRREGIEATGKRGDKETRRRGEDRRTTKKTGQVDKETRRRGDKEKRRQKEKETRRQGGNNKMKQFTIKTANFFKICFRPKKRHIVVIFFSTFCVDSLIAISMNELQSMGYFSQFTRQMTSIKKITNKKH